MNVEPYEHTRSREQLIQAVEDGKMRREEAEEKALAIGLGSLLPSHPVEDFDPMKQERWSLLMALVWVLVRNSDAVRNSWNEYLATQYHWAREGIIGPFRAVRRPNKWVHQVQVFGRVGEYMFAGSPGRSFSVSWTLLRLALRNGPVTAWGRDLREGPLADVRRIPAANWDALLAGAMPPVEALTNLPSFPHRPTHEKPDSEDMLHFGDGTPVYVSVTVERTTLLEIFRETTGGGLMEGHVTSNDPVKQITDAMPVSETKTAYKKRIAIQAILAAFPDGVPPSTVAKDRDRVLNAQLHLIDKTIKPYSERSWTRLCDEVFKKEQEVQ